MDTPVSKTSGTIAHRTFEDKDVDVAAHLAVDADATGKPITPEEALRIKRKIDWHLMPLMCFLYLMVFADKTTLGQSAVLGIIPGAKLTQNDFNWLGTAFYISYLAFQYPQSLALQYLPVGKWMSINILIWAAALCAQAACHDFKSLLGCRLVMGACEGAITPGFMLVTSMFYTRDEQMRRTGYWFGFNGVAIIILGFIAFGVLHTHTPNFMPWQWLMIITGAVTLVVSVLFWFLFPDSPTTAHFLTPSERVLAVQRIKSNQAGTENKHWKQHQFMEALTDPKTWVIALFTAIANITNSLTNQRQLIVAQFGFTEIQTALLGCVDGVVEIVVIFVAVNLASRFKNSRAYVATGFICVAILGSILVNTLPSADKVGLLFAYWVNIFVFPGFVIMLGWVVSITAGHTKRIATNAIVMVAYGVGNAVGQFIWQEKYQPRNHTPWAIISACSASCIILLFVLRWMLARENKKRDGEKYDSKWDDISIVREVDGKLVERRVDKEFLDLTDGQMRDFRYVL